MGIWGISFQSHHLFCPNLAVYWCSWSVPLSWIMHRIVSRCYSRSIITKSKWLISESVFQAGWVEPPAGKTCLCQGVWQVSLSAALTSHLWFGGNAALVRRWRNTGACLHGSNFTTHTIALYLNKALKETFLKQDVGIEFFLKHKKDTKQHPYKITRVQRKWPRTD